MCLENKSLNIYNKIILYNLLKLKIHNEAMKIKRDSLGQVGRIFYV